MHYSRLLLSRILVGAIVAIALTSHHVYSEEAIADLVMEVGGYVLLGVSAMGRAWASAYVAGRKNQVLVQDGPYSITRHPLYFFSFVGFLGAGLAFESLAIASGMVVIFFLTHWGAMLAEEHRLRALFDGEYEAYAVAVPRFVPRPWLLHNSPAVTFNPNVFTRMVFECALIGLVFVFAELVEWGHLHNLIPVLFRVP